MRIFLADDEAAVIQTLTVLLKLDGHFIEWANDGEKAFARLTDPSADFDVLITDHVMPVLTGMQLVTKLRTANFRGKIIVLSGFLTSAIEEDYRALEVDHILRKPFDVVSLRAALAQVEEATGGT